MEYLEPPDNPQDREAWARAVLRYRSWWIGELSGDDVLRRAANIIGGEEVEATERYIRQRAQREANE